MDQVIVDLLQQMGLGVAANAAYDFLKPFVGRPVDPSTLQTGLQNIIRLQGVKMDAATVINALAQKGYLSVQGSRLHGEQGLVFGSIQGGALAGNKTRLSTSNTAINAGKGAFVQTQGNAQIRQNSDGSISFRVGEDCSSISFRTSK